MNVVCYAKSIQNIFLTLGLYAEFSSKGLTSLRDVDFFLILTLFPHDRRNNQIVTNLSSTIYYNVIWIFFLNDRIS